ncbi:phosphoglycolate phosphatase isoform X2 [Tasmannia lanceolata]|uniref:phosphoglycolate phosphatase isoform X2 n=1 Tax=Tasmannia lanceolata TaxID=3420 RepID=UPI004063726B
MAEFAGVPSCANLQLQRSCFKACNLMPRNVYFSMVKRKHFYGKGRVVWFPSRKVRELGAPLAITLEGSRHLKGSSLRCRCLGTLINIGDGAPLNWVPVIDQVLLVASAVFAYMAGVVPPEKAYSNSRKKTSSQEAASANFTSSGSALENENETNPDYAWNEVREKLADALDAIEHDGNLDNRIVESENYTAKRPLSLYAIAEGPRLRLLWATLQRLHKEVSNIPGIHEVDSRVGWLGVLSETIRGSIQPVCVRWLEEELCLENKKQDTPLLTGMFERLKGDDTILLNIKKLGKEDLYADLFFFLRFGALRNGGYYDSILLTQHGVDILEDLIITLADGITSMYLELISVDSSMSGEMSRLGLILCTLSTRALQRLRNEVALNQWLHQNIESVVSMYEDRFDIYSLETQPLEEDPNKIRAERIHWWKKFTLQKSAVTSTSHLRYVVISQLSLPVRRTKELRALTAWRYYVSLFLEFLDISMPLFRAVVAKISSAISFFLVCLIGRSLGLIYTGIRQALGWR